MCDECLTPCGRAPHNRTFSRSPSNGCLSHRIFEGNFQFGVWFTSRDFVRMLSLKPGKILLHPATSDFILCSYFNILLFFTMQTSQVHPSSTWLNLIPRSLPHLSMLMRDESFGLCGSRWANVKIWLFQHGSTTLISPQVTQSALYVALIFFKLYDGEYWTDI